MKLKAISILFILILGLFGIIGCGSLDSGQQQDIRESLKSLRLTEIHYHPLDMDTVSGDEFEFLEIFNPTEESIALNGIGFTDGIEFTFQSKDEIKSGQYLVLASNAARFAERYGFEPFGVYTGKLTNSGEAIVLSRISDASPILTVSFSDASPWPISADGKGYSLVPQDSNGSTPWKGSFAIHGSPGKKDPVPVLINEVATHVDFPDTDAIELFNPNLQDVDIGGWFLSDNSEDLMKYQIPNGTIIKAGGYLVIDAKSFNSATNSSSSFAFSEHGEEVFISMDSLGCKSFCHGFAFGAIENGTTFGRYITSEEEERFIAMSASTLGAKNAEPFQSPLVISEIMYHPSNVMGEYVELINLSADSLPLFDSVATQTTWKLKGFGYTFPAGITLASNEVILILSDSTPVDSFRLAYSIPDSIRIFTTDAKLSNGGDTLALLKPFEPFEDGSGTLVPYRLMERVAFSDKSPWPKEADGTGVALIRKKLKEFGDDVKNWKAAVPSPGKI